MDLLYGRYVGGSVDTKHRNYKILRYIFLTSFLVAGLLPLRRIQGMLESIFGVKIGRKRVLAEYKQWGFCAAILK